MLLNLSLLITILTAALLLPLNIERAVQARICMTPDSPLGNLAKNFLDIPIIKQGIQKKMAENPGNKTFLKVINEASQNMAPPYFPALR
jgi:hypothetical protein